MGAYTCSQFNIMINTFEKLYARDSKGKVRVWWMEVENDGYRTCSGQEDGRIVTSKWKHVKGKNIGKSNETSAGEQAILEVEAKYKKQVKLKYTNNINEIDNVSFRSVMLAEKYFKKYEHKIDFEKEKWGFQIKFNGHRCLTKADGMYTRKNKLYVSAPHVSEAFNSFMLKYPNAEIDGELFNYDYRESLNKLNKIITRKKNITSEMFAQSRELVKFYIYDGYGFPDKNGKLVESDDSYEVRKEALDYQLHQIGNNSLVSVDTIIIENRAHLDKLYNEAVADLQEGGILRKMNAPYKFGRSKNLLKMKPEDDAEGIIINIQEGTGNWKNTAKVALIKWEGKEFEATFKGNREFLTELYSQKDSLVGSEITFLYNGLTGLGIPNFARIDTNNCFKIDR